MECNNIIFFIFLNDNANVSCHSRVEVRTGGKAPLKTTDTHLAHRLAKQYKMKSSQVMSIRSPKLIEVAHLKKSSHPRAWLHCSSGSQSACTALLERLEALGRSSQCAAFREHGFTALQVLNPPIQQLHE